MCDVYSKFSIPLTFLQENPPRKYLAKANIMCNGQKERSGIGISNIILM